jgi:polycystin 1L2
MTQINGFKGFVGYGLRELNANETYFYCSISNKNSLPPLIQSRINFTSDFSLRSYTSGCYFYDTETGKWSSNGMDIYEDTNLDLAHCVSHHLTSFASGLVLSPSTINFQYSYSTVPITQNSIVYSIVIIFLCFYIFFAIWSRIMDKKDENKMGIYFLKDNYPNDLYLYELIVFTGNRSESETNSKVIFGISFHF